MRLNHSDGPHPDRADGDQGIQLPVSARISRPWLNGQGWSAAVTGGHPDWQLSVAEIPSGECDFSAMPGIDRHLVLLEGDGVTLDLDGPRPVPARTVIQFRGEAAPHCHSPREARALNLMVARDRVLADLSLLGVDGPLLLSAPPGGCIVVMKIDGDPAWPGCIDLQPGDAVRSDGATGMTPAGLQLSGHGLVAVATIAPVPVPDE